VNRLFKATWAVLPSNKTLTPLQSALKPKLRRWNGLNYNGKAEICKMLNSGVFSSKQIVCEDIEDE
jgi:hypothetical protein